MTTDQPTPEWTYSRYRAMLRRNGQNFAIVTPDHASALTEDDARILLEALSRPAPDARLRELAKEVCECAGVSMLFLANKIELLAEHLKAGEPT